MSWPHTLLQIRDTKAKYETEISKLKRAVESEKKNATHSLTEANRQREKFEDANTELNSTKSIVRRTTTAFNDLHTEYFNRVGEAPRTQISGEDVMGDDE